MDNSSFENKWSQIRDSQAGQPADEKELFVEPGKEPITQRQLNLYYYFRFIEKYIQPGKKVLEIGCGRGTLSLYLARYLQCKVELLDSADSAIDLAKAAFARHQVPAEFYVRDAVQTGLPEASYDAVISIGLAEHLESVDGLFAEQYRLLKPGGVMISLNIPKKFSIQYLNRFARVVKKFLGLYTGAIAKDYYRNSFTPAEYKAAAERVGFTQTEVMYVCPFPIYTDISMRTDKRVTSMRKRILRLRSWCMKYTYKTNSIVAQAHFLVGFKKM